MQLEQTVIRPIKKYKDLYVCQIEPGLYLDDTGRLLVDEKMISKDLNDLLRQPYYVSSLNLSLHRIVSNEITSTRNVPDDLKIVLSDKRNILQNYLKQSLKLYLKEQELKANCEESLGNIKHDLQHAMKRLTSTEFLNILQNSLVEKISNFDIDIFNHKIHFCRHVEIQKYYRGCLSYLEYDNTSHLIDDYKNTKEFKQYSSRFKNPISFLEHNSNIETREYLSIEDKDWLCYFQEYVVKNEIKEYTLEEAKRQIQFINPNISLEIDDIDLDK